MVNKTKLETLYRKYNKKSLVSPDPLQFLYDYEAVQDREIAALIAACFAYGNVKHVIKTVDRILKTTGAPYNYLRHSTRQEMKQTFKTFKYRFTTSGQLVNLLTAIQNIVRKYGSLENCFLAYYDESHENVATALNGFAKELRAHGEVGTLVPDPDKKSALKRLNLFLRWMVRCDEVDPGGWHQVKKEHLIMKYMLQTIGYRQLKRFSKWKNKAISI